ncbi:MAG: xylosidase/arabinosidase [Verrucomicrobia bacterium]|nr:xylosidase/arabinosidase [Verrucomicrobiota bacterium]
MPQRPIPLPLPSALFRVAAAAILLVSGNAVCAVPAKPETLAGKVMCGYQGWFATPADSGKGWRHYGFGPAGQCHIDLWPDVTGFPQSELHETPLKFADGAPAKVFSSANPETVARHFEWMRDYGIDGVFLQRFGTELRSPGGRAHPDRVLENVRRAAETAGRSWCVMYDLSGLRAGEIESVVMQDWKRLRNEAKITASPAYQRHRGKPVVAVWGIGFNDGRDYTVDECGELVRFLHDNPEFGGQTVMVGVPWGWRTLDRDASSDPKLHQALDRADIISPWAVGRYHDDASASRMISATQPGDLTWCKERGKEFMPVVFPGFSWTNLMRSRGKDTPLDQIPRRGGKFLWHQARERLNGGAGMLYVAMFDEMDEGTAIFKTAAKVPTGTRGFVTEPGLPSDHYLWLTGMIARSLREGKPLPADLPSRR